MTAILLATPRGLTGTAWAFARKDFLHLLPAWIAFAYITLVSSVPLSGWNLLAEAAVWIVSLQWWLRDPLGSQNAFWRSRALPSTRLFLAKAMGLFVMVAIPVLVLQMVVLARIPGIAPWLGWILLESILYLAVLMVLTGVVTVFASTAMAAAGAVVGSILGLYGLLHVLRLLGVDPIGTDLTRSWLRSDTLRLGAVAVLGLATFALGTMPGRWSRALAVPPFVVAVILLLPIGLTATSPTARTLAPPPHADLEVVPSVEGDTLRLGLIFPMEKGGIHTDSMVVESVFDDGTTIRWQPSRAQTGAARVLVELDDAAAVARARAEPSTLSIRSKGGHQYVLDAQSIELDDVAPAESGALVRWLTDAREVLRLDGFSWRHHNRGTRARGPSTTTAKLVNGEEVVMSTHQSAHSEIAGLLLFPRVFVNTRELEIASTAAAHGVSVDDIEVLLYVESQPMTSAGYTARIEDFVFADDLEAFRVVMTLDPRHTRGAR